MWLCVEKGESREAGRMEAMLKVSLMEILRAWDERKRNQ